MRTFATGLRFSVVPRRAHVCGPIPYSAYPQPKPPFALDPATLLYGDHAPVPVWDPTDQQVRQFTDMAFPVSGWDGARRLLRIAHRVLDLRLEREEWQVVRGIEWCPIHSGVFDEIGRGGDECDLADDSDSCIRQPVFVQRPPVTSQEEQ